MKTILTISGSQRVDSLNTQFIQAFHANAPEGITLTQADWSQIPLFNQDLEATNFPESVKALKEQIRAADGIIISTPEYNRSVPGPLKNMIDWTSRPYGDSAWDGKPVYIVGATGGPVGTARAQAHLQNTMLFLNTRVMGQPEFYLGMAHEKFAEDGALTDETTKSYIQRALAAFIAFIA